MAVQTEAGRTGAGERDGPVLMGEDEAGVADFAVAMGLDGVELLEAEFTRTTEGEDEAEDEADDDEDDDEAEGDDAETGDGCGSLEGVDSKAP